MIKISKKSWSYKLLKFMGVDIPDNLCNYFWSVVGHSVLITLLSAAVLIIISLLLSPLLHVINPNEFPTKLMLLGLYIDSAILLTVLIGLFSNSLLYKYIMSVKNKYCPKITFTEK